MGAGVSAQALADRMRRMPELGIEIKGFFTKDGAPNVGLKAPVLGKYQDVLRLAQSGVDEIVVALPRSDATEQDEVLRSLGDTPLDIHLVPDLYDYIVVGCTVEDFDQVPVLALNEAPIDALGAFWKRLFDIAGATAALLIFSPLFFILAILVKLTSRGPIFYGQTRMSMDGTTFKMWKFRSMKVDAEKETGAVWAKKGDDRRTVIGSFLRSTSLDEIPQFGIS